MDEKVPLFLSCRGRTKTRSDPAARRTDGHEAVGQWFSSQGPQTDGNPQRRSQVLCEKKNKDSCMSVQECQLFFLGKNTLYFGIIFFFFV